MGAHLKNGEFQSDKYPTCPAGKVPLSVKDPTAQDLLWEYAQRRRAVDEEFAGDLETALHMAGYTPPITKARIGDTVRHKVTQRSGTVNRVENGGATIWVNYTGPYDSGEFVLLAPRIEAR